MPEVGHILRKAREEKGIDLKDVERALKIRYKFLAAFEKDQPIPELNDIYIRGFLKCYAEYLELDADRILQAYGSGPQMTQTPLRYGPTPAPSFSAMSSNKEPAEEIKKPQARTTWAMLSAAVVVIALIGFAAVSMARNANSPSSAEATAAWALTRVLEASEAISDTLGSSATPRGTPLPTATLTRTPTPTATATATLTPTPEFYTGVNIELIARAKAWVRIRVDGNKAFEGMIEPGTRRSWRGEERVEVRCGNAGGVEAVVNGESIGLLGESGQVVDMEWVKEKGTGPQVEPPATIPASTEASTAATVSPAP